MGGHNSPTPIIPPLVSAPIAGAEDIHIQLSLGLPSPAVPSASQPPPLPDHYRPHCRLRPPTALLLPLGPGQPHERRQRPGTLHRPCTERTRPTPRGQRQQEGREGSCDGLGRRQSALALEELFRDLDAEGGLRGLSQDLLVLPYTPNPGQVSLSGRGQLADVPDVPDVPKGPSASKSRRGSKGSLAISWQRNNS